MSYIELKKVFWQHNMVAKIHAKKNGFYGFHNFVETKGRGQGI